jgi:hypothetical protein
MAELRARCAQTEAPVAEVAMTTGELLLYWLSHVGEGSWAAFRRALSALQVGRDENDAATPGWVRTRLSVLGHADFFIGGGDRWRTFAPILGGLSDRSMATFVGGRTPLLVQALQGSAEKESCRIEVRQNPDGPDSIRVTGSSEAIGRTARQAGIRYVPYLASALCGLLEPITSVISRAAVGAPPINWSVRSYDFDGLQWVDGLLHRTAYEYRSRYGPRRWYVRGPAHTLLMLDRRNAVYAAAYSRRVPLLSYNEPGRELTVPRSAPLPDPLARVAAACSGDPARGRQGQLVYADVPPAIARTLMVAAGQRPSEPHWLTNERSTG